MKKLYRLFTVAALAALALVGCSDDNNAAPENSEVGGGNFSFSVTEITRTGCKVTITPADRHMGYIAMVVRQSDFNRFASDDAVIANDLEDFTAEAEYNNVTLEKVLIDNYLRFGVEEVEFTDELTVGTDYYVYAYGLTEKGQATTKLEKFAFTTEAVEQVEIAFDIQIPEKTATSITVEVSAEPASAAYFFSILTEEEYSQYGSEKDAVTSDVAEIVDYYRQMGAPVVQMYQALASFGKDSDTFSDLRTGSKYYVYAVGINEEFVPNSAPKFLKVETAGVKPSDNTFDIKIDAVTYCSVEGVITATNNDQYVWCYQTQEELSRFSTDNEIMEAIVATYSEYGMLETLLHNGTSKIENVNTLQPDTDYCLLAFGWDDAPTTKLFKQEFHTDKAETDATKLTVDFTISDISHNNATVEATPNCGVYYFFEIAEADYFESLKNEMGQDKACVQLLNDAVVDMMSWGMTSQEAALELATIGPGRKSYYLELEPETSYIAYAISINMETGEAGCEKGFVSEVFTTSPKIVSKADVVFTAGKYYDGDQLAEINPARYGQLAGKGVLSYTLEPNADAAHWYTNFYYGDWYAGSDPDNLYMMLVEYGYENPYDENPDGVLLDSRGGFYVLPYDVPYTFCSIAKDANGVFGPGYTEVVTLTKEGAAPGSEFPELNQISNLRHPAQRASLPKRDAKKVKLHR